jgi:hypothetical protein
MSDVKRVVRDLNIDVTEAIFRAEDATRKAIAAWEVVHTAEATIAGDERTTEIERAIAYRGVGSAGMRVDMLKTILGKEV